MQTTLTIQTRGPGLYEFTHDITGWIATTGAQSGLLTLFVRHTSASLLIQENADPDVQADLNEFFRRLIPENQAWVSHTAEGADDMPAHIKAALTPVSLGIPVTGGRLALSTWQGIYLFEHRRAPHRRQIAAHLAQTG